MKKGFLIGLSIVLAFLFFLVIRGGRDMDKNFQLRGNSSMKDVQIIQKDNGEVLWTLHAKKADFSEDEEKAELTDMSMVMKQNDIVLYTKRGSYNFSDKRFSTDCPVKARAKDFLITAESIDYDVTSGTIMSDGRVELDSDKMKIAGKGLKTATGQTITIYDDVKATFYQ
jgi:hypothetical protein